MPDDKDAPGGCFVLIMIIGLALLLMSYQRELAERLDRLEHFLDLPPCQVHLFYTDCKDPKK